MLQKSIALLFAGFLMLGLSACEKEEGPLEKAGKSLDQATTDAGKSLDQATESVKESYEDTKDAVTNGKVVDSISADLAAITGQKPVVARAKKSIATFKLSNLALCSSNHL